MWGHMQHIWPKSVVMTHTPYKWLKWSYPFHWCIRISLWENLLIHTWFTSDSISLLEDVKVFSCGILGALALGPSALAAARFGAMLFFKGLQTGMRQREGSKAAEDGGSMAEAECKSKGPFRKTAGSKISPECKALFHDLTWIAPAKQESLGMILLNRCRPAFTALQAPLSRWWQTCTTPCQCHTSKCHPHFYRNAKRIKMPTLIDNRMFYSSHGWVWIKSFGISTCFSGFGS